MVNTVTQQGRRRHRHTTQLPAPDRYLPLATIAHEVASPTPIRASAPWSPSIPPVIPGSTPVAATLSVTSGTQRRGLLSTRQVAPSSGSDAKPIPGSRPNVALTMSSFSESPGPPSSGSLPGPRSPRRSPPWRADNVVELPVLDDPPGSGPDPDNQCTPPPRAAVGVASPSRTAFDGVLVVLRSRPSRLRLATGPILRCNMVQAYPSERPEPKKSWWEGGARWNRTTDLSIISLCRQRR